MQIQLNGSPHPTTAQSVQQLLSELELPSSGIAVAVNGRVVRRADHENQLLNDNDNVEIIRAVQGG